jgi:hypothetical protein
VSGTPKISALQIIADLEVGGASVLASRLVSSLAPPSRRRRGERLRTRSGIPGNGEQEQGHAQSRRTRGDVCEDGFPARGRRLPTLTCRTRREECFPGLSKFQKSAATWTTTYETRTPKNRCFSSRIAEVGLAPEKIYKECHYQAPGSLQELPCTDFTPPSNEVARTACLASNARHAVTEGVEGFAK